MLNIYLLFALFIVGFTALPMIERYRVRNELPSSVRGILIDTDAKVSQLKKQEDNLIERINILNATSKEYRKKGMTTALIRANQLNSRLNSVKLEITSLIKSLEESVAIIEMEGAHGDIDGVNPLDDLRARLDNADEVLRRTHTEIQMTDH